MYWLNKARKKIAILGLAKAIRNPSPAAWSRVGISRLTSRLVATVLGLRKVRTPKYIRNSAPQALVASNNAGSSNSRPPRPLTVSIAHKNMPAPWQRAHARPAMMPALPECSATTARLGPGDIAPSKQITTKERESEEIMTAPRHTTQGNSGVILTH